MRFENVEILAFAHVLPERAVPSAELEARLAPLYERLRLSAGRLEMMSGIRERRFFEPGTRPSAIATRAGARAIEKSGIERDRIGCIVHAAVCRDFLEPATASVVHHALELSPRCVAFDLSNACLGFANAMAVTGAMIDRGEIEAALVVSGEDGGPLVEATLRALVANPKAGRADLKRAHASLTIGSAGAACVLVRGPSAQPHGRAEAPLPRQAEAQNPKQAGTQQPKTEHERSPRTWKLLGGAALADTQHHVLCQGDHEADLGGPLMETDSEAMLQAGNALAARTFETFLEEVRWSREDIDRVVTHQVGSVHRKLLFETLGLDPARDFPTVETLGNTGSAALPVSFSMAEEAGFFGRRERDPRIPGIQAAPWTREASGPRVAMLGIGSGLSCLMLALEGR